MINIEKHSSLWGNGINSRGRMFYGRGPLSYPRSPFGQLFPLNLLLFVLKEEKERKEKKVYFFLFFFSF